MNTINARFISYLFFFKNLLTITCGVYIFVWAKIAKIYISFYNNCFS